MDDGLAGLAVATPLHFVNDVAQPLVAFTQTLPEENPAATAIVMALLPCPVDIVTLAGTLQLNVAPLMVLTEKLYVFPGHK
jgi:hypothetical protein